MPKITGRGARAGHTEMSGRGKPTQHLMVGEVEYLTGARPLVRWRTRRRGAGEQHFKTPDEASDFFWKLYGEVKEEEESYGVTGNPHSA